VMEDAEIVETATAGFTIVRSPLLDLNGVAAWLGTSHRHVRRMVAERRIPYVKVGHYIRFDQVEVARWIDERRVCPGYLTSES
jgi:excisionase family DNA binding protein